LNWSRRCTASESSDGQRASRTDAVFSNGTACIRNAAVASGAVSAAAVIAANTPDGHAIGFAIHVMVIGANVSAHKSDLALGKGEGDGCKREAKE
jgi:hypothetical protein